MPVEPGLPKDPEYLEYLEKQKQKHPPNTILDSAKAQAKLAEILQAVEAATDPTWAVTATNVLLQLAYSQETVVSDDLWQVFAKPEKGQALGPITRKLQAAGLLEKTGKSPNSKQVSRNGGLVAEWRRVVKNCEICTTGILKPVWLPEFKCQSCGHIQKIKV